MHHLLGDLPASAPPMSLLRTCVSAMGLSDPRAESSDLGTNLEMAQEMTAQIASIVASIHRIRRGYAPVQPEPGLSHAGNFLYMLHGKRPDDAAARIFDGCLILHAEHEFNASTFAARVIAATLSDIYSCHRRLLDLPEYPPAGLNSLFDHPVIMGQCQERRLKLARGEEDAFVEHRLEECCVQTAVGGDRGLVIDNVAVVEKAGEHGGYAVYRIGHPFLAGNL